MLSFVPSLALLPIRTRPYRHPTGEPGEMDGRLNVSRKWQAPLGSGPGFLLLCLLLWDVALESGPHVFPSVCCGSQSGGRGRGQANRTCTAASVPCPPWGDGAPWRTARERWARARPAFPLQPCHLRRGDVADTPCRRPLVPRFFPVCRREVISFLICPSVFCFLPVVMRRQLSLPSQGRRRHLSCSDCRGRCRAAVS